MEEYDFSNEVVRVKLEVGHIIDGIDFDSNYTHKKFILKAMIDACVNELIQIETP